MVEEQQRRQQWWWWHYSYYLKVCNFKRKMEEEAAAANGRSQTEATAELKEKKKKKKVKSKYSYLPKIGCLRIEEDEQGNFDVAVDSINGEPANPYHLVVMVNGIIGSAQNWKFAAEQFLKRYPRDVIVHCSKANSATLTFDGVDVMGDRLAEEILSVIERNPSVKKISFIGHSLGGLVARYAIAKLFRQDPGKENSLGNGNCKSDVSGDTSVEEKFTSRIAGLEPMNFITLATPHLGSKWHKQVPLFCGSYTLERMAARMSWCLGKTGKHLFLTDGGNGKTPLLLQMVRDSENLKFMSALQSFKHHIAYANTRFDHLVGWSTSSLRRRNELPKRRHLSRDEKYRHIVRMEASKTSSPQQELPADAKVDECKSIDMEDEMIQALTKVSWERVDVKFNGYRQRFLAHNTILVKTYCLYSDGADVVQHMIDNFRL
ncbi:putative lipase ROG1 isoform X1 [Ricinus communis]|uniref:putative lipase ROG1 isoform X1 n=1 Tax=Ricinus communis TaxID=3988 RepID=UPI00201B21B0|nr:putative lipase ROG1 isoform X1 [Ricinus communis]XP_048227020.1 putative lipase ROG1 isoform X1 [Ricinus communis]